MSQEAFSDSYNSLTYTQSHTMADTGRQNFTDKIGAAVKVCNDERRIACTDRCPARL